MTDKAPRPGQESVWDYPRPPRVEPSTRRVRVEFGGRVVADTRNALRVLETSHPPTWYLPPEDVRRELLRPAPGRSLCEWKGVASYWTLVVDGRESPQAAWSYAAPTADFAVLAGHYAFYPGRVDACLVDDERVQPQPGDFYGGWVTSDVAGPFKGGPGSAGW